MAAKLREKWLNLSREDSQAVAAVATSNVDYSSRAFLRLAELRQDAEAAEAAMEAESVEHRHPAPEVTARPIADGDPRPDALKSWRERAELWGWRTSVTYNRGHRLDSRGTKELIHVVTLRMRRDDHAGWGAVTCWFAPVRDKLSWTNHLVYTWRAGHFVRAAKLEDRRTGDRSVPIETLAAHLERPVSGEDRDA
jgi:hypothetical protein